jgi:hypothetical protein
VDVKGVVATLAGTILLYSAVKNYRPQDVVKWALGGPRERWRISRRDRKECGRWRRWRRWRIVVTGGRTYALPGVKPWVRAAANEVGNKYDVATIGGVSGRGYASDHPGGWALDFMVGSDRAKGDAIAAYGIANAARLGITYIIWYRRIWEAGTWKPYLHTPDGNTSPTALHMDHVHYSFTHTAPAGGGAAVEPTQGFGIGGIADNIPGVAEAKAAYDVLKEFTKAAEWITNPANWLRLTALIAGAVLLGIGLLSIDKVNSAVTKTAKTAGKVVSNA